MTTTAQERSGARFNTRVRRPVGLSHQPTAATDYYASQGDEASAAVRGMYEPEPSVYRRQPDLADNG